MLTIRSVTVSLAILLLAGAVHADPITVVTGGDYRQGLGLEITNSIYDTITLAPLSGAQLIGSTETGVEVGTIAFVVGVNCITCQLTPTFHDAVDFTANGMTQSFDFNYTWSSVGPVDTLTFGSPGSLTFDLGNGNSLRVRFLTPGVLSGGLLGGDSTTYTEPLLADFTVAPWAVASSIHVASVPEPATLWCLGLGLGGLAVARCRSRRRRPALAA